MPNIVAITPIYRIFIPRLCRLSERVWPSIGAAEWSRQSRIKAGIWTVTKKSEASFANWHCFLKKSPSWSLCLTPGENTSGLNLEMWYHYQPYIALLIIYLLKYHLMVIENSVGKWRTWYQIRFLLEILLLMLLF